MSKLKPCPFCGSEAELTIYYDFYRFHCPDPECEAHLPDGVVVNGIGNWHPSIPDAKDAWNTRAERMCKLICHEVEIPDSLKEKGVEVLVFECDQCGERMFSDYNYCPNCGAKVTEEDTDGRQRD